ncbi:MAG TPA: fumarylacetoacetate hydrolase family protein [Epulopiscium sp.]|nr:fumarylacetoacetate hydrolase family protein [Candidatus Epulonipiscium sp.]
MKFITYIYNEEERVGFNEEEHIGFVEEDRVYKIKGYDMVGLIGNYEKIDFEGIRKSEAPLLMADIKILSPIVKPIHDVICVGKNYADHIREMGSEVPEDFIATYFGKRATRIMGSNEEIEGRFDLDEGMDYESELAVIIGKECKNVKKEDALDYIFGFTIFNDITSRIIQKKHNQWFRGKSFDQYNAMGPYIVTKDEVDHGNLAIKSYVNDELRQNSNTNNMIIKIEEIIEELSSGMTLEPGDIISTGTPEGVGMGYKPPRFLKAGDCVRCEVEGLGSLVSRIV